MGSIFLCSLNCALWTGKDVESSAALSDFLGKVAQRLAETTTKQARQKEKSKGEHADDTKSKVESYWIAGDTY